MLEVYSLGSASPNISKKWNKKDQSSNSAWKTAFVNLLRCMSPAPPFSDFGFENELNRLYFVCTRLYTYFFVCTPLTFLLLLGGWGHAIPPFLILDSKMGSIVCTSFVYNCIRLFSSFVHLLLFFLSWRGERAGDMLYIPFSDFGFENGLNHLYFVCTWLYTAFFVCIPHTFYLSWGGGWGHATLFWFLIRKWA